MITDKGTHNNHPVKRGAVSGERYVALTILLLLCVCPSRVLRAQVSEFSHLAWADHAVSIDLPTGYLGHYEGALWITSGVRRSFGLKELDEPWVSVGSARQAVSVAIAVKTSGWDRMRHVDMGAISRYRTDGFSATLGAELRMLRLPAPYVNDHAILIRSEVRKAISRDVHLAARVANLTGSEWTRGGDPLERRAEVYASAVVKNTVMWGAGLGISDQHRPDVQSYWLWRPNEQVVFRLGVASHPSRVEVGLRFDREGWLAASSLAKITHSAIGWRQEYWLGRIVP